MSERSANHVGSEAGCRPDRPDPNAKSMKTLTLAPNERERPPRSELAKYQRTAGAKVRDGRGTDPARRSAGLRTHHAAHGCSLATEAT